MVSAIQIPKWPVLTLLANTDVGPNRELSSLMDRRGRPVLFSPHASAPFSSTMKIRTDPWRLSCHLRQWLGIGPCVRPTHERHCLIGQTTDRSGGGNTCTVDRPPPRDRRARAG